MTDLTDHFSLAEVTHSDTASRSNIDNSLPMNLMSAVLNTASKMEKVRAALDNRPISVTSWYRSLELNRLLGSKDSSQHRKGEAVDFICPAYGTSLQICKQIISFQSLIRYDQLILEHTWVHISWASNPNTQQRGQVLSLLSNGGYANGLTDKTGATYGNV